MIESAALGTVSTLVLSLGPGSTESGEIVAGGSKVARE